MEYLKCPEKECGDFSFGWISLKWVGNVGRKILQRRAMLLCVCAALCIRVMLPSSSGAERRNFTQGFSGKNVPV